MKQIAVVSGKGGTGKTIVTSCFASLMENKVIADCDVDAANLHLMVQPTEIYKRDFFGTFVAEITPENCRACGKCRRYCRFGAISLNSQTGKYEIDPFLCEGCGVCDLVCPADAVELKETKSGEIYISDTPYGKFSHAKLGIAQENSGKLASEVKSQAEELAKETGAEFILLDGPPGVACPVISTLSGTDAAVIVTEPSVSGVHDLKRVAELAKGFDTKIFVCVNKADINPSRSAEIRDFCEEQDIGFLGEIPFDKELVELMSKQMIPVESETKAGKAVQEIYRKLMRELKE